MTRGTVAWDPSGSRCAASLRTRRTGDRDSRKALQEFNCTLAHHLRHLTAARTNNIALAPVVKDAWGLPAMRLTYRDHPDGLKTRRSFRERSLEILEAGGSPRQDAHRPGTFLHDVPNLYIVDGSSFVTSGGIIQPAPSRRWRMGADHIIRAAKNGA